MQEDRVPSSPDDLLGIGERLRNAREAKGLTLAVAETLTRIRATYLSALEEEQFARLPGAVYARGYLRTYALALGLDPDDLMEAYPGAGSTSRCRPPAHAGCWYRPTARKSSRAPSTPATSACGAPARA